MTGTLNVGYFEGNPWPRCVDCMTPVVWAGSVWRHTRTDNMDCPAVDRRTEQQ